MSVENWMARNPTLFWKETPRWGRVVCHWDELKRDGTTLCHRYAASFDLKTGHLYPDCRLRKLWLKHLTLLVVRPLQGVFLTAYHLSLIGIIVEVAKGVFNSKSAKEIALNCGKSLASIIWVPLSALGMEITALAACLITPFSPHLLYDFRWLQGRQEELMFFNTRRTPFMIARCFTAPFQITEDGILPTYARLLISDRRSRYHPFYQCIGKLDPNTVYVSAWFK